MFLDCFFHSALANQISALNFHTQESDAKTDDGCSCAAKPSCIDSTFVVLQRQLHGNGSSVARITYLLSNVQYN